MAGSLRRVHWVIVLLSAGVFFPLDPELGSAADGDVSAFDGVWKLISVESEGESRRFDEDVRWTIKKSKVSFGGELLATLASYPETEPKGIDLAFHEPKREFEGIYALEKEELRICLNTQTVGAKERPIDFATKEKAGVRVLTFRRISPADAGPERQRGFIGIALAAADGEVVIQSALEGSPAKEAGLLAGDVVVSIADQGVEDLRSAVESVRRAPPGRELQVQVRRDGKSKKIAVKVAVFPFSLLGVLD